MSSAFRVLEVVAGAPGSVPRLHAPLIGRGDELQRIVDVFERSTADRACRLVEVIGEPGIGKSRLVDEFATVIGSRASVLRGRCPAYGEATTFMPLVQTIRQAAGIDEDDPPERARASLGSVLGGDDPSAPAAVERLAELLDLPTDLDAPTRTSWAVRMLFESVASRRPLIVIVDDAQWAEPSLLEIVLDLVSPSHTTAILMVLAARPELRERTPAWDQGLEGVALVELAPLPDRAALELVEALLGGAGTAPELATSVVEIADGNPLFIEEVLSRMVDEAMIERRPEGWVRARGSAPDVPPSLQGLLQSRLEQLGLDERSLLEAAAVEGYAFHLDRAEAIVRGLHGDPGPSFADLLRRDILRPARTKTAGGHELRFRHQLMRDVAYSAIPKARRSQLHERLATHLEERGDHEAELADVVGAHLERAHAYGVELGWPDGRLEPLASRAADHLLVAGRHAAMAFANEEALDRYRRAMDLLDRDDMRRLAASEGEGTVLAFVGRAEEAEAHLTGALVQASSADPLVRSRLHRERALARRNGHVWDGAEHDLSSAERMLDEMLERDDPWWHEWIEIQLERMTFLYFAMRREELAELFADVSEEISRHATPSQLARLWTARVDVDFDTDHCDVTAASLADADEYLRAARAAGDPSTIAFACLGNGFFRFVRGDISGSRERLAEGLALADRVGDAMTACRILSYLPLPLRDAADPAPAREAAERGVEVATACRVDEYVAVARGHLAWVAWAEGRPEEAVRLGEEAFAGFADFELRYPMRWIAMWPLVAARERLGQIPAAVERAADLLEPSQWPHPSSAITLVQAAVRALDEADLREAQARLADALEIARAANVL